jgi:cation diffusion facilitator family transporter
MAHTHAHGHAHDHSHDHAHDDHDHAEPHTDDGAHDRGHAHVPTASRLTGEFTPSEARQARRLSIVLGIVASFFVFELAGAIAARSVVLQADAAHLLMDVLALAMSLVAMRLAVRRPTPRFTFGLRRAEPVAAIFNATLVLGATVEIVNEAVGELRGHASPNATIMLVVAVAALGVNGASAWLIHGAMHEGHDHSVARGDPDNPDDKKAHGHALNLRGAWLHLVGDTLGALAALGAAIVIRVGGPTAVDPIASFVVAIILVLGAVRLMRDATLVLLEAAPPHLSIATIRETILAFPGVCEVHDLHVWMLGAGHDAITAHVRATVVDATLGARLSQKLRARFDVEYVTVQIETDGGDPCGAPPSQYRSA